MRVFVGVSYNFRKVVLNILEPVKVKSRETSNQGVCIQKSCFMYKIPS